MSKQDGYGIWLWNDNVSNIDIAESFYLDFVSNGVTFSGLDVAPEHIGYTDSDYIEIFDGTWLLPDYRSFTILSHSEPSDGAFLSMLNSYATFQGEAEPEPVIYDLFIDISNGVKRNISIEPGQTVTTYLDPNSGYTYPTSVSVTGCTLNSYDSSNGKVVVSNATGNCRVVGDCVLLPAVQAPKYLDETGLKEFSTKTKTYIDNCTTSRITNIVVDDTAKTIKLTIETSGGGQPITPEPTLTDELLGTWVFNETLTNDDKDFFDWYISFTNNDIKYNEIYYDYIAEINDSGEIVSVDSAYLSYLSSSDETVIAPEPTTAYTYIDNNVKVDKWRNETLRTITITDTSALTNREEFTTWLNANATKQ